MVTLNPYSFIVETGYKLLAAVSPCNAWSHFQELQSNQWLSYNQLSAIRWKKIKQLLNFSYEQIPFYRRIWKEHGVNPTLFTSEKDMIKLPVVTKQMIAEAQKKDEFLLSKKGKYDVSHTSGTTGDRFQVPFTFLGFQKKYANHLRQVYASDWCLGVKSATLHYSGHNQFRGKYSGRVQDREPFVTFRESALRIAHRRRILTPYYETLSGNDMFAQEWYEELKRYKPFMFETMDFNLPVLKEYIERNNLPPLSIPKTFVLGTYSKNLRNSLEEFFNTEIFDRYSPHEIEGVAFACHTHKGMHMAIDCYHIEFLDAHQQPVGPGETGFITVTDLDNDLLPLIRYQVGDVGHYYEDACSCGRGFPLMGEIDGRARDLFRLKNGKTIAPSKIAAILQDEPSITLFQVTQTLNDAITVKIIPDTKRYTTLVTEQVQGRLTELLGSDENIIITLVEHISLEANGKCCFVKREQPAT